MDIIKNRLDKVMQLICITILGIMVLLVLWQVAARYFFNNPSTISEVLTRYLFVWLVMLTATFVFGQREHMYIAFVQNLFPPKVKRAINIIIELIVIFFALAVMVYGGIRITGMQMVQLDPTLQIPVGYVYAIIPLCGVIIALYCLYNLKLIISQKDTPEQGLEGGTL